MSNSPSEFRCPVCHARQPLQAECRRCRADLSLVVRVHRRIEFVAAERDEAIRRGDTATAQRLAEELSLLSPRHMTPVCG